MVYASTFQAVNAYLNFDIKNANQKLCSVDSSTHLKSSQVLSILDGGITSRPINFRQKRDYYECSFCDHNCNIYCVEDNTK